MQIANKVNVGWGDIENASTESDVFLFYFYRARKLEFCIQSAFVYKHFWYFFK